MKTDLKQLLRDLRGAVMLNHPQAVDMALNGLLKLPGVASNDRMSDHTIDHIVLPVGEILATLKAPVLRPLTTHHLAVGRAVGGVALAHRLVKQTDTTAKDLVRPASDPRQDVRQALGKAVLGLSTTYPTKIFDLAKAWLSQPGSRLRYTALVFLPGLASSCPMQLLDLVSNLDGDSDRDVRAALVEALNTLARHALAVPVLDLLAIWSEKSEPNTWVISRILSASWVSEHPFEVKSILRTLQTKTGESGDIQHARKALKRHGLEIDLGGTGPGQKNDIEEIT